MSTILDLNDDLKALFNLTDIDPQTLKDTADALTMSRDDKLDGLAYVIEGDEKEIDWLKDKIQDLQKELKARKNHEASLKEYLVTALDDAGLKKLQTENHMLKTRKPPASVDVIDESKVPAQYIIHKDETRVDKKKLRDILKENNVPGVRLKQKKGVIIK